MGVPALIAATVATGVVSAAGQIYAANQQNSIAQYNASVARTNAESAKQWGEYREAREREKQKYYRSGMVTAYLKSGVSIDSGSPKVVLDQQLIQDEMDALAIRRGGQAEAQNYRSQAAVMARQGKVAQTAGYIGAGSTLLTAGVNAYTTKLALT